MFDKFKILIAISISFASLSVFAQDDDYNWSQSIAYGLDENGNVIVIGESKSYADEFGKPLQTQFENYTENTVFAVQLIYDSDGRPAISTLPAPIGSSFGYKANFVQNLSGENYSSTDFDTSSKLNNPNPVGNQVGTLGWYYSESNSDEPNIATTSYPYSRSWTPSGPDTRISKVAGVGDAYRLGTGHEVSSEKLLISSGELNHYYSLRSHFVSTPNPANLNDAYKIVNTNSEGKKSYTYIDADGKTLMTKINDSNAIYSYAYYNDMGQLVASVAPQGINTASSSYPQFVTLYTYDHRGLLIETTSPDAGEIHYQYASDGKLRFSQNSEQLARGNNVFSYTHYDKLGRLIEAGEYQGTLLFNSTALKDLLDQNGSLWPESQVVDWNKIYYDLPQADFPSDPNHIDQGFTYGAITATENEQTKTWYNYDEFGRVGFVIQLIKGLSKYVTLDYTYDFLGNVTKVAFQRDVVGEAFFHHYNYDSDQRLSTVSTSVDGVEANAYLQATYYYYKHGPLKRVELATDLQGIDYTYTAQGALKSINHPDHNDDPGQDGVANGFIKDVLGLTLEYYEGDYASPGSGFGSLNLDDSELQQKFNGNIRAVSYGEEGLGLDHPADDYLILDQYKTDEKDALARKSITLKPGFNTGVEKFDAHIDPLGTYQIPNEPPKMYAYKYNDLEQLQTAIYDEQGSFNYNSQQNRVGDMVYDKNGNIRDLIRKDDEGNGLHNFDYQYTPGTNQLAAITGYASYEYDPLGRVIKVDYVGTEEDAYLEYDVYDNVIAIYSASTKQPQNLRLSFTYSDQGYRLMKKNHDQDLETWYIRDVAGNLVSLYYRYQGQLFQGELPIYGASRLGIAYRNTSYYKYNYELSDHQGNVRAVISKLKFMETASMEPEMALLEEGAFDNITATRRQDAIFNHTPDSHVNGASYAAWLNGALGRVVGPAKSLKVAAGDVVKMDVYANYVDPNPTNDLIAGLALSVANAYNFGLGNETTTYLSALQDALSGPAAVTAAPPSGAPKAYMQYLLFDENFNYVSSIPVGDTYTMVTTNAMVTKNGSGQIINIPHEHLENEITIPQDGYLFVYLVNETVNDLNVYFDDFTVMQLGVDILQTSEYYPMGLAFSEWSKGNDKYRFGYQGQFAEHDEETGWSSFELRMYDPIITRWLSTDPYGQFSSPYLGMGNNPGATDVDGGWSAIATGAIAGAVVGTTVGLAFDSDNWWKYGLGGAALGVLGGGIYNASTYNIPGLGRIGKGGGGVQRAAQATFSAPDVSASIAVMNGIIKGNSNSILIGIELPGLSIPLTPPQYQGVSILVTRFMQTNNSTTSTFTLTDPNGNSLSGYFLEPRGPGSTINGSDQRILTGIYDVSQWNSVDHPNTFILNNVPGRSYVLLHPGNYPCDTEGCLLPGSTFDTDFVGGTNYTNNSAAIMLQIRTIINNNGVHKGIRMRIREIFPR
ncbi:MAG TPA: DUF5675 family protein [Fulvivirga sp.]|nr:DUF5675 family protein [Fulvivirga sp.]